jgi:hypothetical protein
MKHLLKTFLLLGFMVFISAISSAQLSTANGGKNPEFKTADAKGVKLYNLNSWNVANVTVALTNAKAALEPKINDGSATPVERYSYHYYSAILADMQYDIAPEILLLNKIEYANKLAGGSISKTDQQNVYNQIILSF